MTDSDSVPVGLGERGRRVWEQSLKLLPSMPDWCREVLLEACRTADLIERFEADAASEPLTLTTDKGSVITNPFHVELRQQRASLKQLLAALRLPDEAAGSRPQKRVGNSTGVRVASARDRLKAV